MMELIRELQHVKKTVLVNKIIYVSSKRLKIYTCLQNLKLNRHSNFIFRKFLFEYRKQYITAKLVRITF